MREIKFRVPIECKNCNFKGFQYYEWNGQSFTPDGYDKCDCEKLEIVGEPQQLSGSVDKNEVKIFEGDIIKGLYGEQSKSDKTLVYGKVIFTNGCFKISFQGIHDLTLNDLYNNGKTFWRVENSVSEWFYEIIDMEIIGNIFENPELINHPLT